MELMINKYETFKKKLDTELSKTAESFVRIGYLLKLARDNPAILEGSGYANINEMAAAEYGIDKTIVSRWININDDFSEGGYSDRLKAEYQGYGYSKLAIMLSIPEQIREEITPDFSKSEIQALKDEIDAEKAISPIEVYMEGQAAEQEEIKGNLDKALHQLLMENPEMYVELYHANNMKAVNEIMAPAGESIYTVRIQGVGRFMLSIKGIDTDIALMNVRNPEEKEKFSWNQLVNALDRLIDRSMPDKDSWERTYNAKFPEPEKPKVAPVQQKSVPKKEEKPKKKPQKVVKAKELKVKDVKSPNSLRTEALPEQKKIEDYPEFLPENPQKEPEFVENIQNHEENEQSESAKKPENPLCEGNFEVTENDHEKTITGYKAAVTAGIRRLSDLWQSDKPATERYKKMIEESETIVWRLKKILEMEEQ